MNHITDNHDALLDYLYEEGDPAERLRVATHLQECAACAVAVLEFQNVRGMLSDWAPPASLLGFRMVQDAGASSSVRAASPGASVVLPSAGETSPSATLTSPSATVEQGARGGWSWGWGPTTTKEKSRGRGAATPEERSRRWTGPRARPLFQAAAAILLFVSGMAVSQLHVEYENGELRVRLQSDRSEAPPPVNSRIGWIMLPPERGLSEYELIRDLVPKLKNASSADAEGLLERVRSMIDQSEQRQQRELALRVSQVAREVETQHQVDVQRIEQNFGRQQDATMDYLVKTSGGVK